MKNKLLSLNLQLLVLPMLALLISPDQASSATLSNNGGSDIGVNGSSTTNFGVYGTSIGNIGIVGNSTNNIGVYGSSSNNIGIYGSSPNNIGIVGASSNNVGVYGTSTSYIAVEGYSPSGYSAYFLGGSGGNGSCAYTGGAGWNCTSDRNLKENFTAIDVKEILQRVRQLPITRWNMKGQKTTDQHIGPMSQDFHAAFAVGEDDKHINTADIQGVALAAIQGLYQVVQDKDAKLQKQEAKIQKQEAEIARLQKQMDAMKSQFTAKLTSLEQAVHADSMPVRQHRIVVVQRKPGG